MPVRGRAVSRRSRAGTRSRVRGALDVHRDLLAQGVPHEMVRLRRPVLSADDLPASLELPASSCVAVRCYLADGRLLAVMVHAGAVPDPGALLDAVRARALRAATATEVNAATEFAAGLVSPVGLPREAMLLADAALGESDVLYCATGEGGVALGVRTRDLLVAVGARVANLSGSPMDDADRAGWGGVVALADVIDLDRRAVGRRPRRPTA